MTALTDAQRVLLQAANDGRLTVSGVRYYLDGVEVDTAAKWLASDLLADSLLFIPDVSKAAKYKQVRPTVRGLDALNHIEVDR